MLLFQLTYEMHPRQLAQIDFRTITERSRHAEYSSLHYLIGLRTGRERWSREFGRFHLWAEVAKKTRKLSPGFTRGLPSEIPHPHWP
jgi:hypothetical protein